VYLKILKFSIAVVLIMLNFSCPKNEKENFALSKTRALKDTVGFSFTNTQIKSVIELSGKLEHGAIQQNLKKYGHDRWIAGVCPHDDHLLAGRVYVHLFQNLRAQRFVVFGVAHKAWKWGTQDYLIFDSFDYWRAPSGTVKVSDLREEIIDLLPDKDFVINNEWQSEEHSVEGIVPFIQYYNPQAEIVSILVPYMNWVKIEKLSQNFAAALAKIIKKHNWKPGEDIAFICSNDGNHYGDLDWGGKNLAPFGTDKKGYLKATTQDINLSKSTLLGTLTSEKLQNFCNRVWGENDLKEYKICWCGRFAIPFGLNTVKKMIENLGQAALNGYFLRYDTSYNLGKLPLENIGIGTTAPNNIHHWVGYSAIGYR